MTRLKPYAKAAIGAAVAFAGAGAAAAADGIISAAEWWTMAVATLTALYAVWRVPNTTQGDARDAASR